MDVDAFSVLVALGAGAFAAAIGGQNAFVLTGFAYLYGLSGLLGGGPGDFIDFVVFGPVLGPHIAFAGGAAAAAYAWRRGYVDTANDIITPLARLGKPDVLAVGAVFGVVGYLTERLVALVPWFGQNTDTVATAVVLSGFFARWVFGRQSGFGPYPQGMSPLSTKDDTHWVEWQEGWGISAAHGLFSGILFAGAALFIWDVYGVDAYQIGWAVSAVTLTFHSLGMKVPVTHHMTIIAGLAALTFYPIVGQNLGVAALIGAAAGVMAAWLGEILARLFNNRGNTYIDPPAFAIFISHTIVVTIAGITA